MRPQYGHAQYLKQALVGVAANLEAGKAVL
jgi:hypothetical protein